tara:strand:+ start:8461 stop:8838 length:378 start_codon:yes stop_codon:yes gene_type:complete
MKMQPDQNNASRFVLSRSANRHEVNTPDGMLIVYVKPLSWIEQQEAMSQFVDFKIVDGEASPSIDLGGYWRYVLTRCIEKTEPSLSKEDLLNLKPEVGDAIKDVLPSLTDIMQQFASGGDANPLV